MLPWSPAIHTFVPALLAHIQIIIVADAAVVVRVAIDLFGAVVTSDILVAAFAVLTSAVPGFAPEG